ncbi:MAG: hypothetical protein ABEH58_09960 [Haloplanus sp.]
MTGVLDRLRAWFGTAVGGETTETDDNAPATAESDAPDRRVVHRDDRPLETPSTMGRAAPPSVSTPQPAQVGMPDTEGETEADDGPAPADVSIPDAEAETAVDGPETDGAVACSVCGTTVDDPSAPCPLCRSTDVVPVADAPGETADDTPERGDHTAVSTADDEAVERLRDVREGE